MIESQNPEINVQELMARVRAEVEKRKALRPAPPVGPPAVPASTTGATASPFHPLRENIAVALNRARQKNHVSPRVPALIHPFFRNQGGFNFQLLRAIELQTQQLDALQNEVANIQQASRSEVADLRTALVDSLDQIRALQAGIAEQVGTLHGILKQQQSGIERHAQQADALQNELAGFQQASRGELTDLRAVLASIQQAGRREVADLRAALVNNLNQIKALQAGTSEQVDGLHGALKVQQAQGDSAQQQIRALESQLVGLADRLMPKPPSPEWDAFYLTFENQFRGSRADIKERVRIYLPYLAEAGVGTADKPVLDLGCGRGEWLELLRENGHVARGADTNTCMVSTCRELGLDAEEADALAMLHSLADGSLGAVTGFHILEHLPFKVLIELFQQAFRVLDNGGLIIFETPNPNNIQVGSNRFYLDPTHLNPIPHHLVQFAAENSGFKLVQVLPLHPDANNLKIDGGSPQLTHFINAMFFGPQDYALIATKP